MSSLRAHSFGQQLSLHFALTLVKMVEFVLDQILAIVGGLGTVGPPVKTLPVIQCVKMDFVQSLMFANATLGGKEVPVKHQFAHKGAPLRVEHA